VEEIGGSIPTLSTIKSTTYWTHVKGFGRKLKPEISRSLRLVGFSLGCNQANIETLEFAG